PGGGHTSWKVEPNHGRHRSQPVIKQVGCVTTSVVPVLSPAEIAFGTERSLRGGPQPHLPVQIVRADLSIRPVCTSDARNRIVPHSFLSVAVVTDQSPENLAHFAGPDIFIDLPVQSIGRA